MAGDVDIATLGVEFDDRGLRRADRASDRTERSLNRLSRQADDVGRRGSKAMGAFGDSALMLKGIIGSLGLGLLIKQLSDVEKAAFRIQNTLGVALGADLAGAGFDYVASEADRLGLNLESAAGAFAKFQAAAKGSSLQGEGAAKVFTAVSEASTALGLSGEQTAGALLSLEQMVSKGKVSMEELRQQLGERIPGAFIDAATAMGVTTQELDKLVSTGQVTADELLPKLADLWSNKYGAAAMDAAQQTEALENRLSTAFFNLNRAINEAGAADLYRDVVGGLTDIVGEFEVAIRATEEFEKANGEGLNAAEQDMRAFAAAMGDNTAAGINFLMTIPDAFATVVQAGTIAIVGGADAFANAWKIVVTKSLQQWDEFREGFLGTLGSIAHKIPGLSDLGDAFDQAAQEAGQAAEAADGLTDVYAEQIEVALEASGDLVKSYVDETVAAYEARDAALALGTARREAKASDLGGGPGGAGGGGPTDDEIKAAEKLAQALAKLEGEADPAIAAMQKLGAATGVLNQALAAGLIDAERYTELLYFFQQQRFEGLHEATDATGDLSDAFADLEEAIVGVSTAHGKAFANILQGIDSAHKGQGKLTKDTLRGYAQMADGAQGLFDEGSRGYQALGAISQAFHAAEVAATLAELPLKGTEAVLTQGQGEPYSAPARMAAMAAIVASLGVAIGGSFGGGGGARRPSGNINRGTGTVLGDVTAQSESLANSMDQIENLAESELSVSQDMLFTLRSIDASIRDVGVGLAAAIGTRGSNTPFRGRAYRPGTGLAFDTGQTFGDILGGEGAGVQYFGTTQNLFGRQTEFADVEAGVANDITKVLSGIGSAILEAADLLGLDAEEARRTLEAITIGLDEVNLRGLDAEEIQERLAAVFSAVGDTAAQTMEALLGGGLIEFQRLGEGALETLIRIASETDALTRAFDNMGLALDGLDTIVRVRVTQALIELSGGFDELASNVGDYLDNFFTEDERIAQKTDFLNDALAEFGETLPATREQFRALVESLDPENVDDQRLLAVLLGLADTAGDVYDYIEERAEESVERQVESLDELASAEKNRIDGLIDEERQLLRTIDASRRAAAGIRSYIDSLYVGNLSPLSPIERVQAAKDQFVELASLAQGGDLDAASKLTGAANTLLTLGQEVYASSLPFQDLFRLVENTLGPLADSLEAASPEVAALESVEREIEAGNVYLRGIYEEIQRLREGTETVDETVDVQANDDIPINPIDTSENVVYINDPALVDTLERLNARVAELESARINLTVVTEDGERIVERTIDTVLERSEQGEVVIDARGVRARANR